MPKDDDVYKIEEADGANRWSSHSQARTLAQALDLAANTYRTHRHVRITFHGLVIFEWQR